MANDLIDPAKVKKDMDAIIEMITHPQFVAAMKDMKQTPVAKRQEVGKKTLTVQALAAKGVKIPANMRITTRYFEPGSTDILEVDPNGKLKKIKTSKFPFEIPGLGRPGGSVAWGACACGGAATVCGGAGGST